MTSAWLTPAGSALDTMPEKMRFVPSPSSRGPITEKVTLTTASTSTSRSQRRSGLSLPISRRADGPKVIAFSAGALMPPNGPCPPPGPRAGGRSAAGRSLVASLMLLPPL